MTVLASVTTAPNPQMPIVVRMCFGVASKSFLFTHRSISKLCTQSRRSYSPFATKKGRPLGPSLHQPRLQTWLDRLPDPLQGSDGSNSSELS